ncbi:uncharacterized protein LOC130772121 [Actinidia eriantha]|uniref:uncharacterized protein LOC130772121 n=1 Tax=Actinidia eriantha TaxID=165200 RepID=UPI0025885DC8|nr:uncharacterized protein LOC130772121 [Actinidia eriantha]
MDDYLGLFSDSWSFENDVPSGESISNNSRDYTAEFTTNQIFESREAMINWAKRVGLENEVVGITSTMRTYSLMFTYLSNERVEQLTWALGTLKKWMVEKGASLPSVFVSDRDLALINAIESCFPMARHILCVWHINQCVMKKCAPMLGMEWKRFYASWHLLINSSTQWSYQQKWEVMREEYQRFEGVLKYLWETWLHPYKNRFVSAWVDTCMHLGSNSSQRAESAHARLKLYLGDTMSSLQTSFEKIHKMLRIQLGDIKKSFERSLNISRHQHLHNDIFSQVRCRISLEAMELISGQLQCAEEASHQLTGKCNCSIKIVYALPCEHDLAHYRYFAILIPLQSINAHWRMLSMDIHEFNDEGARPNRTSHVVDILDRMDPHIREHMIDRFINMADPSQSTVRAPSYNTEHRGRPKGKDEQSRRRSFLSFEYASTSGSRVTQPKATFQGRGRQGRGLGVRNSPIRDTYIEKLPVALQRYISHTIDVQADGHCGFRAIAALIGYGEEGWSQVRFELMEEIQQNKDLYDHFYPDQNLVDNLLFSLNWFEPWAPQMYWMDSMPLGIVIALRYNLVLHTFGENVGSCFTHLPLRTPPVSNQERREIAIAHVGNHFVQLFLHSHYPVPPIPMWWWQHSAYEAKGWAARYETRVHLWYEVIGTSPSAPGADFGGNID